MAGDLGEVREREGPSYLLPLRVHVHDVVLGDDQGLVGFVAQVIHNLVRGISALVGSLQCHLPLLELHKLTCNIKSNEPMNAWLCLRHTAPFIGP